MADPLAFTARFQDALRTSNQIRVVRADVYNGTTFIKTIPLADSTSTGSSNTGTGNANASVNVGTLTVDHTATVRRTLTFSLVDQGLFFDNGAPNPNSLVPEKAGDILHPLSQNELHLFRGFQYADGSEDMCALGVFRFTQPVVEDTGDAVTITITGQDRSSEISRIKWTGAYQIQAGADLATTVIGILNNRWPGPGKLDFSQITPTNPVPAGYPLAGTNLMVPTTTFGLDLANQNDPWADLQSLAISAGCDLYFDPYGRPVLVPVANPVNYVPVFVDIFEEGPTSSLVETKQLLDETGTYSGVIAIGTGAGGNVPPVVSQALSPSNGQPYTGVWNTDPDSPTYFDPGNPFASLIGPVPYIFETQAIPAPGDTTAAAQLKINAVALAQLQLVLTAYQNPSFQCVPNPALWENDIITLQRARAGIVGNFVVQAINLPLDVVTAMTVTCKPQASPTAS